MHQAALDRGTCATDAAAASRHGRAGDRRRRSKLTGIVLLRLWKKLVSWAMKAADSSGSLSCCSDCWLGQLLRGASLPSSSSSLPGSHSSCSAADEVGLEAGEAGMASQAQLLVGCAC